MMHCTITLKVEFDLTQPEVAEIILVSIQEHDGVLYELLYCCLMPNHVHLVFFTGNIANPKTLGYIMKIIKGSTSRKINIYLNRSGTFWQKASYDRLVRDEEELNNIANYVMNNPVKARLVKESEEWPYLYVKYL